MSERIKLRGQLAEAEQKEREMVLKLAGLRDSLRDILDPIAEVGEINGEQLAAQGVEYERVRIDLAVVRSRIHLIKQHLGA